MPQVSETTPPVLDARQLVRIESTHRGFLYQHLFAVACLLEARRLGLKSLLMERDEDVELVTTGLRTYVQVKKRAEPLAPSDISDAVERFAKLRQVHADGTRSGGAEFWIVSNSNPSESLSRQLASPEWPADVLIKTPEICTGDPSHLPAPWPGLEDAFAGCRTLAAEVPFSLLSPDTLVWKLAAEVQFASAGTAPYAAHEFKLESLPDLLEQFVRQLQSFPPPTTSYRPHENEPELASERHVRLIVGFSGAGKTAWAGEVAIHAAEHSCYFDVVDMPSGSVASALSRELVAKLVPAGSKELRSVLLPGASGLQSLSALNSLLRSGDFEIRVVMDNVHRMESPDLRAIVRSLPHVGWILLAQPWPGSPVIEAEFDVTPEVLSGWSQDTIAEELHAKVCVASPGACERVRSLTGALPLFVRDASRLISRDYAGDTERFCAVLGALTNTVTSGQQLILREVKGRLTVGSARCAGILSLAEVPLSSEETQSLLKSVLGLDAQQLATALRELTDWGILHSSHNEQLWMHDSFRIIAKELLLGEEAGVTHRARKVLAFILKDTLAGAGLNRFRLYCQLLPLIGQTKVLIDIATKNSEFFYEYGITEDFNKILSVAAHDANLPEEERFWAADTLAFWAIQQGEMNSAAELIQHMRALLPALAGERSATSAVMLKSMLVAGAQRKLPEVRELYSRLADLADEPTYQRIFCYNYAAALHQCGKSDECVKETFSLVMQYYDVLGIDLGDVVASNLPEMATKLGDVAEKSDDLKRLGDCLDLQAKALLALGKPSGLARIHAHKFYILADAITSAIKVGRDFVDECLSQRADVVGARKFMEEALLPLVTQRKLLGHVVPVKSQYAVVLAYCGEIDSAKQTMAGLEKYAEGVPEQRDECANQRRLVENIANGHVQLRRSSPFQSREISRPKIGRNEKCPCGSGKKYKKCCGK
jgi:hypothetical protein